jgi:CHAT domain-containing protein
VLRRQGQPHWQRLKGSGPRGTWTEEDRTLPGRLYRALIDPTNTDTQAVAKALRKQRLEPLRPRLRATGDLPAVRRLFVVATDRMARVPVEVLGEEYTVSYVPSGSIFARLRQLHRPLQGTSLLALGDPVFDRGVPPAPPASGVLLASVLAGSNAAKAGLQAGDVLLAVGRQKVMSSDNLTEALKLAPATVTFWREGRRRKGRLPAAPLGAVVDPRSARAAVRAWRRQQETVATRGTGHKRLPGTLWEVQSVARLVPGAMVLTGSLASEQQLDRLNQGNGLKRYRLLHFATHGETDEGEPDRSALILAQDQLPDPLKQAQARRKVYDGRLTVQTIRREWTLDADLVVLGACQTALGQEAGGEGLLGFAHALLSKGARGLVLSRWKVDDTATALLMIRFYENLLGKRPGLNKGMKRAEALAEAKKWLAGLKRKQAGELAARLSGGVLRGTEAEAKPVVKGKPAKLPQGEYPFAHPYYWAAFVLVGDAD